MHDHSMGAARHLLDLMETELANQHTRLYPGSGRASWPATPSGNVPGIRVASPGIVEISALNVPPREASFFRVIEHLWLAYNDSGDAGMHKPLHPHPDDRRILPYPANSPSHLQVGDTVPTATGFPWGRGATVRSILLSHAGGSRPVVAASRSSDAVVEIDWRDGSPLRFRATDLPPQGSVLSKVRSEMPHLKRISAQAGRVLSDQVRLVRAGGGWDRRLLDLCAMRSAAVRLSEETASPPASPEAGELAFLRLRRRGVRTLAESLSMRMERIVGKPALLDSVAAEDAALSRLIAAKFERTGPSPSR